MDIGLCVDLLWEGQIIILYICYPNIELFKQEKLVTKEIQLRTDQSTEELRDCFEDTEWQLFFDACKDVHETPSHLTEVFVKVIVLRLK